MIDFVKKAVQASSQPRWFSVGTFLLVCALISSPLAGIGRAQTSTTLSQARKLYVDSLGTSAGAVAMRNQLVRRLGKAHEVEIVSDRQTADAVLQGSGELWSTGRNSLSPRPHGPTQTVVEGFLSVEVIGRNNQPLWSYLVTPSKFSWNSVSDDLAAQVAGRLLAAINDKSQAPTRPDGTSETAPVYLHGAGATFPAPLYQKWFQSYQDDHANTRLSYDAIGSSEGIRQLKEGKLDFAASEMPLDRESRPEETGSESRSRFIQVPIVLGAVVPIYNLPGLHQRLNFTPEILEGIYIGRIKHWNDPQIKSGNPGSSLPDAEIVVVHRSDGSGTSFVWTQYLSKVSTRWKATVGTGATVAWPVGIGAEHNDGVASSVQQTPNSIGYVEFIYAIQHSLSFGMVRNAAGRYIKADIASVTAAARRPDTPESNLPLSVIDSNEKSAYPIATYTWLLLPAESADQEKKSSLVNLVRWMLTSGQKSCSSLGYAPLPAEVSARALRSLE